MLRWLRFQIRNYFAFNRKETNGTIVLILMMVLLLAVPFFYAQYLDTRAPVIAAADKAKLDSLLAVLDQRDHNEASTRAAELPVVNQQQANILFAFDPNKASLDELQRLGVASKMAERIQNYRSKGGKFRVKKDLLKVYGFPAPLFTRLAPYILLPDSLVAVDQKTPVIESSPAPLAKPAAMTTFDLNKADSTLLIKLRGIGSGYSRRILNYRDKLGGFVRQEQVKEVYGLDSMAAEEVLKYGFVEINFVPLQLNLNSASVDELKAHPYISAGLARLIVAYRQQHGPYQEIEEVKNIKLLKEEDFLKLSPYLKVK